jgi:hypothetical protein
MTRRSATFDFPTGSVFTTQQLIVRRCLIYFDSTSAGSEGMTICSSKDHRPASPNGRSHEGKVARTIWTLRRVSPQGGQQPSRCLILCLPSLPPRTRQSLQNMASCETPGPLSRPHDRITGYALSLTSQRLPNGRKSCNRLPPAIRSNQQRSNSIDFRAPVRSINAWSYRDFSGLGVPQGFVSR